MSAILQSAWRYRFFIISSIQTEFATRFARSWFGGLWMIFNPLAQVAIYALILSQVLAAKLPGSGDKYTYASYLMAGLLGWNLFSDVLNRCLTVFIDNGNLLKKMAFPRITLPLIVTGTAIVNNFLLFSAIIVVFGLLGRVPTVTIMWLPILTILTVGLAVGLGLILGIINVFVRDVGQLVPILLQFWFWLTPVVYSVQIIPEAYRNYLLLNPMTGIVFGYQNILVYGQMPDLTMLFYPMVLSIIGLGVAFFLFRQASEEMVDAL